MMRLVFGAVLGLLVAYPALLAVVLAVVAAVVSQPAVLAAAAGIALWPRITRRIRGGRHDRAQPAREGGGRRPGRRDGHRRRATRPGRRRARQGRHRPAAGRAAARLPAPAAKQFDTKKWLVIGGTACVCSIAFALASIAIAIGACCATVCLLILRHLFNDLRKGRGEADDR